MNMKWQFLKWFVYKNRKTMITVSLALMVSQLSCQELNNKNKALHMFVFDVGDLQVYDISNWNPGVDVGKSVKFACPAYLIRHPKGDLVWDTGLNDGIADLPEGISNPRLTGKLFRTLSSQLNEIKVAPSEVKYLAVSHSHNDHIGNANLFRNATLIVQEEEYNDMFNGSEVLPFVDSLKNNKAIKLKGDFDVFGDGSVIIKRAPGHTAGHQVLFVNLPETGPIVLSGDLYHFAKNRELKGVPEFNFSSELTIKSMKEIEAFIKQKKATLWIQHDIDHFMKTPHAPKIIR
jgi:glyoxylase-like metal-dependent hydrolase (beta-lactamase superfamily II)